MITLLILISSDTLLGMRDLPPQTRLTSLFLFFFFFFFFFVLGGWRELESVYHYADQAPILFYRNIFKRTGLVYLPGFIGLLKDLHNLSYSGLGYLTQKVILVKTLDTEKKKKCGTLDRNKMFAFSLCQLV